MKNRKHVAVSSGKTVRAASLGLHVQVWNTMLPADVQLSPWEEQKKAEESVGVVVEIVDEGELATAYAHRMLWYLCCQDEELPPKPAIVLVPAVKEGSPLRCEPPLELHWTPLQGVVGTRDDAICKEIAAVWAQHRGGRFSICFLRSERNDDPLLMHFESCRRIFHSVPAPLKSEPNEWRLVPLEQPGGDVRAQIFKVVNAAEKPRWAHVFYCIADSPPPAFNEAAGALVGANLGWRSYVIPFKNGGYAFCLQQPRPPAWPERRTVLGFLRRAQ